MPRFTLGDALVLSPPGLGTLTIREARHLNLHPVAVSRDRRADVVGIRRPGDGVRQLRTAEDVVVVAGTLAVRHTATGTAAAIDPTRVRAALAMAGLTSPSRQSRGLRVVVRLSDERRFLRTALRAAVERRLGQLHDPGHEADELWVLQTDRGALHIGVRVRDLSRRRRRAVERAGALRPAIAAAMVLCAGRPRRVLDPCCGSGTILMEVTDTGAAAVGGDIDTGALVAAFANSSSSLMNLDARRLPFAGDSFDAVITNLPFGHQHQLEGSPVAWYRRTLSEALRVAPTVVVLAPPAPAFRQALGRTRANLVERHHVRVLGQAAAIWKLHRR